MPLAEPESPVLKTPEWLEALENKRKRTHKLAHEIGAGAPCLVCKDGCKGLNLHFWRKLCIECKCRKEDHEVQEEEDYAQFEILLGAKKVKRTTLKFDTQNKTFDWIPPNVEPDLAVDYLKSIPSSKLPISNTDGARYRKQQLEKQVPLHDVDPSACFNLSENEMKEFQKYLDNLKDNVIGQGKILKYQSPKMIKENYIHGTSPNMIATSEEYVDKKPQGVEILGQLTIGKTQRYNAFSESLQTESFPAETKFLKHSLPVSSDVNSSHSFRTQPLGKSESKNTNSPFVRHDLNFSPKPFQPSTNAYREDASKTNPDSTQLGYQGSMSLKTPSSFINKNLQMHDKQNNNTQPDNNCNIGFPPGSATEKSFFPSNPEIASGKSGESKISQANTGFHQDPYNASLCRDPLTDFKELSISSSNVPFVPVQESGNMYTPNRKVSDNTQFLSKDKLGIQPEDIPNTFPTPPETCQQCLEILNPEEVVVQAERGGTSALWHAKCFVCETCKELLVDLMYFYHKGKVFCGRHYAEMMKIPRCYGCDELIFVKEYTIAEGQSYHVRHFCCFHCDDPLGGKQYIPKDSFPVCLNCYQIKYGKDCRTCGLPIAAGEQRVSWKDLDFHVSPECFKCSQCKKSLLGGKFVVKNSNTFCSKECVQQFPECNGDKLFKPLELKLCSFCRNLKIVLKGSKFRRHFAKNFCLQSDNKTY